MQFFVSGKVIRTTKTAFDRQPITPKPDKNQGKILNVYLFQNDLFSHDLAYPHIFIEMI